MKNPNFVTLILYIYIFVARNSHFGGRKLRQASKCFTRENCAREFLKRIHTIR